jgi:xanthine dehydrogenase YagT iron-sulfur-binding subunit
MTDPNSSRGVTRRGFLKGVGVAAVTPSILSSASAQDAGSADGQVFGPGSHELRLRINGQDQRVQAEPRTTLLDVLRNQLQLTGSKEVCDQGSCGACSVLLDGELSNACMLLAVDCVGHEILTIEGLAQGDELHPISAAFVEDDALQCGYCTPGMVMASYACLSKKPNASLDEIKDAISGNLCRCGTYNNIFTAVQKAQKRMGGGR